MLSDISKQGLSVFANFSLTDCQGSTVRYPEQANPLAPRSQLSRIHRIQSTKTVCSLFPSIGILSLEKKRQKQIHLPSKEHILQLQIPLYLC